MSTNYGQVLFDDNIADDYGKELLKSGIIEAKAGNKNSARRYFDRATYMSSDHDVMAEAWFQLSQVTDDPVEKRKALENCLSNDLQHARARRTLAILDGKIKPDEIIDPDALPAAPDAFVAGRRAEIHVPQVRRSHDICSRRSIIVLRVLCAQSIPPYASSSKAGRFHRCDGDCAWT